MCWSFKKMYNFRFVLSIKLYRLSEKMFLCLTSENTTGFHTPRLSPLPGPGIKSSLFPSVRPSKIQFLTSLGPSNLLYLINVTTLGKGHKLAHWFSRLDLYNQRPPSSVSWYVPSFDPPLAVTMETGDCWRQQTTADTL